MPILDMPLKELEVYAGRNPRPADFDAFWDAALREMNETDPQPTFTPAAFQAPGVECYDLTFTGTGGSRVYAKYLRPKSARSAPAVLQFHGYTGNSGDWADKLAYAASGFCVAAMDCRGQGGRSEDITAVRGTTMRGHIVRGLSDKPENMLFRHIFLDTAMLFRIISALPEVDGSRVCAMGGSQGGALTVACAALSPGLYRAAPTVPFLSDYKRVWEMDLKKSAYEEIFTYFRQYDPLHAREEEIFTQLGYIDIQFLAPRVRCPILWGVGLMDDICPASSQYAAYNKIPGKKAIRVYPDYGHENLPGFSDETFAFFTDQIGV